VENDYAHRATGILIALIQLPSMLLLSIDTSGKNGSIALADAAETPDQVEVLAVSWLTGGTFSAQLIPQIADLLKSQGHTKNDIGAFAVVSGPGSFTGLRVGLAAVKALAEVLNKPIAAVSLLETCAFVSDIRGRVLTALDAGRGDAYAAGYELPLSGEEHAREMVLTRSELFEQAKGSTIVTPDSVLGDAAKSAGLSVSLLPPISAADVARLGWRKIRDGETVSPAQLEANYIRRTEAEMLEKIRS
jgi:tRNA threonylcarbamoyladenosine biosynthesis protein TsaB